MGHRRNPKTDLLGTLDDLPWYEDSPDTGDPACICSYCGFLIPENEPAFRLYKNKNGDLLVDSIQKILDNGTADPIQKIIDNGPAVLECRLHGRCFEIIGFKLGSEVQHG